MLQCLLPWPMNALITNQLNGSLICQEDKQTYPIAQPSGCRRGPPDAWFSPDPFCGIWFLLSLLAPELIPWITEKGKETKQNRNRGTLKEGDNRMRPVTICGPGNSFIMVLPTHSSQREPQGEKQAPEKSLSGVRERPGKKQLKYFLLWHRSTSISKGEEYRFHHLQLIRVTGIMFFRKKKKADVAAVAEEQSPSLRPRNEGVAGCWLVLHTDGTLLLWKWHRFQGHF